VDAATLLSGQNPLTGDHVGFGGRLIAFAGFASPLGGGQIRGLIGGAKHTLSEGLVRVTAGFTDRVLQRTYRGAIREINRHKDILRNASPEQVNSIMEDLVKHEKRLQATIEEMNRRGLSPGGN
jgi:hypothetical protein